MEGIEKEGVEEEEAMDVDGDSTSKSAQLIDLLRGFLSIQQRRAEAYAKLRRYSILFLSNQFNQLSPIPFSSSFAHAFFFFAHQNSMLGFSNQYEFLIGFFFSFYSFIWVRMAFDPSSKGCVFS